MTSNEEPSKAAKMARDNDEDELDEERLTKAKRHDIDLPTAEVDAKLAEKLDNILKISDTRKPRFFMNKPKTLNNKPSATTSDSNDKISLKHRNLTKEELRQRLMEKYDTLVPELDSKRSTVKLVKILSATESLELGKEQAKKQLERQLELNSIRANQQANTNGIGSFRFQDGYEMPPKCFVPGARKQLSPKNKNVSFASNGKANEVMATVKYFKPDENEAVSDSEEEEEDKEDEDEDDDDLSDDVDEEEDSDDDVTNVDDS